MTLQVCSKPKEWDENEHGADAIVLPGELGSAPAPETEAEKPLTALGEDRASAAAVASRTGVIQQVTRSFTAMTQSLRRGLAPAKKGAKSFAEDAQSAAEDAPKAVLSEENAAAEAPPDKAKTKPLKLSAPLLGGAAVATLALSVTVLKLVVFPSSIPAPQSQEVGMEPNAPTLLAPSAQWALAPKREDIANPLGKETAQKHVDPLSEILALKEPEKKEAGTEAGQSARRAAADAAPKGAGASTAEAVKMSAVADAPKAASANQVAATHAPAAQVAQAEKGQIGEPGGHVLEAGEAGRAAGGNEVHVASIETIAAAAAVEAKKPALEAAPTSVASAPTIAHAPNKTENQVLAMVTELGSIVTKLKEEIAKTAAAEKKATEARDARLDDFERRILFSEAHTAVERAKFAGAAAADVPTGSIPTQAQALNPIKPMQAPGKAGKTSSKIASAGAAASEAAPQRRYRIQAASPGLAMLGEIDALESDAAPLQISVGSDIPGYGRVRSIDQRGAAWVVKTENGVIQ